MLLVHPSIYPSIYSLLLILIWVAGRLEPIPSTIGRGGGGVHAGQVANLTQD